MDDSFYFEHANGQKGLMRQHRIALPMIYQMSWCLRAMGRPGNHTEKLKEALKMHKEAGLLQSSYFERQDRLGKLGGAAVMANNWAMVVGVAKPCESWIEGAKERFGAWLRRDGVKPFFHPKPDAEEDVFIKMLGLEFSAPTASSMEPEKFFLASPSDADKADKLAAALSELSPMYAAAAAEWKDAGLSVGSKTNPFSKPLAALSAGKWVRRGAGSLIQTILEGAFWMAVGCDDKGPVFISPNGTHMREISRARIFATKDEALEWAVRSGGSGAMSLDWSATSCVPVPGRGSTGLEAAFAFKERQEIESCVPQESDEDAPERPKVKSRSL